MSPDRHLPSTASEYFGEMAASYDSLIRRAVPRYDEMQARLIDYMPGRATGIVELGCGTGNLTLAVALRYPEGRLTVADASTGATPEAHDLNWERWLAFCREPGRCTAEEIRSLVDHAAAHDHYESVADHFRTLQAAGFRSVDCAWRNWMWGIVVAERA